MTCQSTASAITAQTLVSSTRVQPAILSTGLRSFVTSQIYATGNAPLPAAQSIGRRSYSAHVRWCEHGAPRQSAIGVRVGFQGDARVTTRPWRSIQTREHPRSANQFTSLTLPAKPHSPHLKALEEGRIRPTYAGANMGHPDRAR